MFPMTSNTAFIFNFTLYQDAWLPGLNDWRLTVKEKTNLKVNTPGIARLLNRLVQHCRPEAPLNNWHS